MIDKKQIISVFILSLFVSFCYYFLISNFLFAKKTIEPESLFNFVNFVYFSFIIIFLFNFLTKGVYDYFVKIQ